MKGVYEPRTETYSDWYLYTSSQITGISLEIQVSTIQIM